jgi:hypothetical protein
MRLRLASSESMKASLHTNGGPVCVEKDDEDLDRMELPEECPLRRNLSATLPYMTKQVHSSSDSKSPQRCIDSPDDNSPPARSLLNRQRVDDQK